MQPACGALSRRLQAEEVLLRADTSQITILLTLGHFGELPLPTVLTSNTEPRGRHIFMGCHMACDGMTYFNLCFLSHAFVHGLGYAWVRSNGQLVLS